MQTDMPVTRPFGNGRAKTAAFLLLLFLGFALILYRAPELPIGLHQDELSEAYESYSLLKTGADRWGYHLPVYFLSWGSGQNVLQSYLTIPVVAVLGLTRLSTRFIPLLCGLLALPFFFLTLKRWYGENVALLGLLFLAVSPWHVMLSRWGIENSPLPFFTILGVYTFGVAFGSNARWKIVLSLIPFALAMYTYGVMTLVVPALLPLLVLIDPAAIRRQWRAWAGALAVFTVLSLPIAFFIVKNYVTKRNYAFEHFLPFSVPLLPITRLDQVMLEKQTASPLVKNIYFATHGLCDYVPWFMVKHVWPIQPIVYVAGVFGLALLLWRACKERRFRDPFLPLMLACFPLFYKVPLNISRGGPLFLPLLGLGAIGASEAFRMVQSQRVRLATVCLWALAFLWPTFRFVHRYFCTSYSQEVAGDFHPGLPKALAAAQAMTGTSPLYITDSIQLNYVQVLFFEKIDPFTFQHSGATYQHPDFGPYRFDHSTLSSLHGRFGFLIIGTDPLPCSAPQRTEIIGQFIVGICPEKTGTPR